MKVMRHKTLNTYFIESGSTNNYTKYYKLLMVSYQKWGVQDRSLRDTASSRLNQFLSAARVLLL